MKTNMKELNLNEMEQANGGFDFKRFVKNTRIDGWDAFRVLCLGPVGHTIVAAKIISAAVPEFTIKD